MSTILKEYILNRTLLFSCLIAIISAAFCSIMNVGGIAVFAFVFLFLLLLFIPLKLKDKRVKIFLIIATSFTLAILCSTLIYFKFCFKPAFEKSDKQIYTQATVIQNNNDHVIAFLDDGFMCKLYFDDDLTEVLPSARINVNCTVNHVNKYANNGVHATAYVGEWTILQEHTKSSPLFWYHSLRQYLKSVLDFGDNKLNSFMYGVVLGDVDNIDGVFMNKFRTVGLSHVMSVSGMHLMFSVNFIGILLAAFEISHKKKAWICIISAFIFAFLSGFAVSCIRAFIMILILNIGIIIDKESDSLTSLFLSAFLIAFLTPYNTLNISFVLSVFATFGLIVISPMIFGLFPAKLFKKSFFLNGVYRFVINSLIASLSACIACIPVFLITFKQISVISPLVNLVMLVPIQLVFYIGFITLFLFPIPFIKYLLVYLYRPLYVCIEKAIDLFYNIKYTTVNDGNTGFYFVFIILLVLVLGIFLYKKIETKFSIFYFIGGYLLLCSLFFSFTFITTNNKLKLKIVDVGHGNSCFFVKNESAVFIDSGGDSKDELIKHLRYSTVKNIDLIAITHADFDHIKYLPDIIDNYTVKRIVYPEFSNPENLSDIFDLAEKYDIELIAISKDEKFEVFGNCFIEAFVEKAYTAKITSNTSALYKFICEDVSVCFPGDMSIHQEYAYLDYGDELDCDILLVPHHGSATSSSVNMLKLYSPDYAVISVDKDNLYKMPDNRVVDRLNKISKVMTTEYNSTIVFEINEKEYKLIR